VSRFGGGGGVLAAAAGVVAAAVGALLALSVAEGDAVGEAGGGRLGWATGAVLL
jgi:hypothetical protein